ncbi:DUF3883 domain-containing protein [Streptomyces halstedii]|uniref:DUF3883 domain-containing protein n=1 Tax=Streptomyces halstedii TaxID=1944 RepID=A0ABS6TNA4_STRHA|nr:DUF3883 domain-containing protein [Streptomyces halstedii]MBV7669656.1 DUF3883 domain-containing protein [Streptomyces halstedii]
MTAVRVVRLPVMLTTIRKYPPPGIDTEKARRHLWRQCGGPIDDVPLLLDVLMQIGLVEVQDTWLKVTKAGLKVATQDHQSGGRLLGLALIRSGLFASQARSLLEVSEIDVSRSLVCPRDLALTFAPQLTGILRRFAGSVVLTDRLTVAADVVAEISDVWSLLPPTAGPDFDYRKDMGNRGELYSYQYCRLAADDPAKVRWVARDDETLGYDIEDANFAPKRMIEVKASGDKSVRFFLSRNEWGMAHRFGDCYEIHFWGGISLKAPVKDEFDKLTGLGYPLIFRGLEGMLASNQLSAVPTQYLVTRSGASERTGPTE